MFFWNNLTKIHLLFIKEVTKDPIVRGKFAHCPAQELLRKRSENMNFTQPEQTLVVVPDEDEVEGLWNNELWRVQKQ